jgi:hypothetical protein
MMSTRKTLFAAGVLAYLLMGCSALAQQPRTTGNQVLKPVKIEGVPVATNHPIDRYSVGNCLETRCYFTVRVNADCQISLDPQWMGVSKRNKEVTIVWQLKDSPGFTFAPSAIFNKPRLGDTADPFAGMRVLKGDLVEVPFKNVPGHVNEYGINIAKGGVVCGTLDPPILPDI